MEKEDNHPKEKFQDHPKMSKLTQILFGAVFAVVSMTICGCEYVAGYSTYPRYNYGYRSRSPFFSPPSSRFHSYPRSSHRYRGYSPHSPQLRITIPFGKRAPHGRTIRPNIQRHRR